MMRSDDGFDDRYQLGRAIGHPGSYGRVHVVVCKRSGRSLAVKIMRKPAQRTTRQDRIRSLMIESEASIMRALRHPHIVSVVDVIDTPAQLCIVMEECRGGDLFDRIMQYQGKIPEPVAVPIYRRLLQAVQYVHGQKIVHGDLKLSNIMFGDESDDSLRVIDFGLSQYRLDGSPPLTEMVGTPNYQAPEVVSGSYSFEADLWSLGVVLFVMVFGFNPFDPFGSTDDSNVIHQRIMAGFNPITTTGYGAFFPADIPASAEVKDLIARLLESNPRLRFRLADVLAHPWMQLPKALPVSDAKAILPGSKIGHLGSMAPCA